MLLRLGDIIGDTVRRLGIAPRLREAMAMRIWNTQIAPGLRSPSYANLIRGKTMHVTVESPVWTQQLTLMKRELLKKVNAIAEDDLLRDIRFHTGQVRVNPGWDIQEADPEWLDQSSRRRNEADESKEPDRPAWRRLTLGEWGTATARRLSEPIGDPEIRARFENLVVEDLRYHTWLRANLPSTVAGAADMLRREPWLSDGALVSLVPGATGDDLARARAIVSSDLKEKIRSFAAQSATCQADGDTSAVKMELRLLVQSLAMVMTGQSPDQLDDDKVSRAVGGEFSAYL